MSSLLLWICRVMIFNSFYGLLKLSNNFFSFIPGLDVRKILHLWPLHAFKKLIIFGVCLPCPPTGLWSCKLECGVWPQESCVFSTLFCTTHWPIFFLLFVCDTNTSYVITFAIENFWTKAHQCLFSNHVV